MGKGGEINSSSQTYLPCTYTEVKWRWTQTRTWKDNLEVSKRKIRPNGIRRSGVQIGIRIEVGGGGWCLSKVSVLPCCGLCRPSVALGPTSVVLFKEQILPSSLSSLLPPRPHNCLVFLEPRCFFKGTQWFCSQPGDGFYPRVMLSNYATERCCTLPLTQLAVFFLHVCVHEWNGMWDVYSRSVVFCLNI